MTYHERLRPLPAGAYLRQYRHRPLSLIDALHLRLDKLIRKRLNGSLTWPLVFVVMFPLQLRVWEMLAESVNAATEDATLAAKY